jgi:hypothetical protein
MSQYIEKLAIFARLVHSFLPMEYDYLLSLRLSQYSIYLRIHEKAPKEV